MSWENNQLNAHPNKIDAQSAKESEIERLAESLIAVSFVAIRYVISSQYSDFTPIDTSRITNSNDEFNEMFYSIAEKVVNSNGG